MAVNIGYTTPTTTSLREIDSANLVTGYSLFVISEQSWYSYNSTSTASVSASDVLAPVSNTGRWFKQFGRVIDGHITDVKVASNAAIAQSKISGLVTALGGKANTIHTHLAADITNFAEAVDDEVASLLIAGENINLVYDDVLNRLTINGALSSEQIDDRVASFLTAGSNITLDYNDVNNTLTISSSGTGTGGGGGVTDWDDIDLTVWDGLYS